MTAGLLVVVGLEVGRFVGQGIDVSSFGSSEPSRVTPGWWWMTCDGHGAAPQLWIPLQAR